MGRPSRQKDGPTPPAPQNQVQIPITKTSIHHQFISEVQDLPNGGRQLTIVLFNGEVLAFPFEREPAEQLGRQLLAPRVEVPANGAGLH